MSKSSWESRGLFETPLKPKKNRTPPLKISKAKIRRVVNGAPEVMVKVTGKTAGFRHMKAHMDYITRNATIAAEDEMGQEIATKEDLRAHCREWSAAAGHGEAWRKGVGCKDTVNIVMSMPEGTDPEAVRRATREFARDQFGNSNPYMMVLHTDQKHPHVHLTVRSLGYDGHRLRPQKADLQKWREVFAEKVRDQGVEAEATPRYVRGVVKKQKRQVLGHIEAKGQSKVLVAKKREAALAMAAGLSWENPAADRIAEKQAEIRQGYAALAKALDATKDKQDAELASQLRKFVRGMPRSMLDERAEIRQMVIQEAGRSKGKDIERG